MFSVVRSTLVFIAFTSKMVVETGAFQSGQVLPRSQPAIIRARARSTGVLGIISNLQRFEASSPLRIRRVDRLRALMARTVVT